MALLTAVVAILALNSLATVKLADVLDFLNGMESLGYRFIGPLSLAAPREGT